MSVKDRLNSPVLRKILSIVTAILFGVSLVVCTVIGSFATFATDAEYYRSVQEDIGLTPEWLGLSSEENMTIANESLADYLAGRRDTLQVTVDNYGSEMQLWSDQAVSHMVDVKYLTDTWFTIAIVLGVYLVGYIVYHCITRAGRDRLSRDVIRTYIVVGVCVAVIGGAIAIVGFNDVFIIFHKIFFTNDDWLFSPYDLMVRLLPERFFLTFAIRGGVIIAVVVVVTLALAIGYRTYLKRVKASEK